MSYRNTSFTYGSIAKFFHWLIFILVFAMITLGYFLDDIPKAYKPTIVNMHKLVGISILLLMIMRAFWALTNPRPMPTVPPLWWQRCLERWVHLLLYLAVIAMAFAGWISSVAKAKLPHLGGWQLNLPGIPESKTLAYNAFAVHRMLAIVIIVLVSLHVLAALYHHFIKKDDVLKRMMP